MRRNRTWIFFSLLAILLLLSFSPQGELLDQQYAEEINRVREEHNLPDVHFDPGLQRLASYYSEVCAENGYINHDFIPPTKFAEKMTEFQIFGVVTELLARAPASEYSAEKIISALMNSPVHREGLLNPDRKIFGAAVTFKDRAAYVTIYLSK